MKNEVNYTLDKNLRLDIINIKNIIQNKIINAKIFLFGSIAKGRYSKDSDIDLLVLINGDKSNKELRFLRHEIEDLIDNLKINREVDIKLYNIDRYNILCKEICFESAILEDLVDIRGW
ncbi:nucleotidyltransferase domain-containing protein [Clostridium tarantellae]|uniref:DNA polymerase beta n=1 Tax=Clostridium tarantellae TaxID=39493 RepID=A0A6I1MPU5_9CLOT|nr:nucleotidyltransferase domain-containing protein [Clostridium tarantellae]MPQ44833.1 DNA polymerase beta [Clostridium tarantellae]